MAVIGTDQQIGCIRLRISETDSVAAVCFVNCECSSSNWPSSRLRAWSLFASNLHHRPCARSHADRTDSTERVRTLDGPVDSGSTADLAGCRSTRFVPSFLTSPPLRAAEVRKHYTERQPAR